MLPPIRNSSRRCLTVRNLLSLVRITDPTALIRHRESTRVAIVSLLATQRAPWDLVSSTLDERLAQRWRQSLYPICKLSLTAQLTHNSTGEDQPRGFLKLSCGTCSKAFSGSEKRNMARKDDFLEGTITHLNDNVLLNRNINPIRPLTVQYCPIAEPRQFGDFSGNR